jgi:carbon-monoxide dehydrogenase medium subunit
VKPAAFDYQAPATIADAISLLDSHDDAKAIAGGQSLMPMLNMRIAQPLALVDLAGVRELDYVRQTDGVLAVGAMTTQRTLERDQTVREKAPAVAEVLPHIAHVTIRNRGTIGGSIAHADPAAELPLAAVTLDAELVITGPAGQRSVRADGFFHGFLTTALEHNELLTEIRFPVSPAGTGVGFHEISRRHGDFALAAVLAAVAVDPQGRVSWARIGVGGAHPVPLRVIEAEQRLVGEQPTETVLAAVADAVAEAIQPTPDAHASAEYRRRAVRVLLRRSLDDAIRRTQGNEES